MITDQPAGSKYGAPMGRHTGPEYLDGKCYLRRVRINSGGYDIGGAYWGIGAPLYEAQDQAGNTMIFRAKSRNAAKVELRDTFNVTFYR